MESQPQNPEFLWKVSLKILNSGIILKTFINGTFCDGFIFAKLRSFFKNLTLVKSLCGLLINFGNFSASSQFTPAATSVTTARNAAHSEGLGHFSLRHQVLLSVSLRFLMVCQSIRDRDSTVRSGPSYVAELSRTKFCYVYQVLSRFSTVKRLAMSVFEPVCAHGIK